MTVVPIELDANKPRVAVRVNGAGPFDFLVDTGSVADLLDAERADELVSSGGTTRPAQVRQRSRSRRRGA
jgi:hypothetical protein